MGKFFKQIGTGGIIGLGCALFGFIFGAVCVALAGPVALSIYLAIWGVVLGLFWHYAFGPMVLTARLMEIGEDGEATILAIAENGSSLKMGGALPKSGVRITLDVKPQSGKPAYQASINMFISMFEIQQYQPGAQVKVKIDPNNPQKIVIAEKTGTMQNYSASVGSKE
jgi:hypothetical protein